MDGRKRIVPAENSALIRGEAVDTEGYLIQRPSEKLDIHVSEDSRKATYMKLANMSCFRDGDFQCQSYRMTPAHLWRLWQMIEKHMRPEPTLLHKAEAQSNKIQRLKAALRYFAGGDPLEIQAEFSVLALSTLEECVWDVVDAIHSTSELEITFPESHDEQREIATGFELVKSDAGLNNCCGALGGMLLPTDTSSIKDDRKRDTLFNKRKCLYGFNLQAICDHNGRFLEVCLESPGSASDFTAYKNSSFYHKLQTPRYVADGLHLYTHEYYPDDPLLLKPSHLTGTKEAADEIHFQLRDQVDAAFSSLLQRWALLRRPLPGSLDMRRVKRLVYALCKLQNFSLDDSEFMPPLLAGDVVFGILNGAVMLNENFRPTRLLGAGQHLDDVNEKGTIGDDVAKNDKERAGKRQRLNVQ
jgi:hypothetical protein